MVSLYVFMKLLKRQREKREERESGTRDPHEPTSGTSDEQLENKRLHKQCRVCLKDGYINIYGNLSWSIEEAIRTFGDVDISEDDDYPKSLCLSCFTLLEGAVSFRKTAQQSQHLLKQGSALASTPEPVPTIEYNDEAHCNTDAESVQSQKYTKKRTKKKYSCKLCKMDFTCSSDYLKHKSSPQHKNVRVQCPICFGLLTPSMYKKHVEKHESSHIICEACGKMYRKDNLLRHLQLHSSELPFQCQLCPYRGRYEESLKIHMRTHTGVKPFACNSCPMRFLTRSNLNRHILTHKKERPFKCKECSRSFHTKRDLESHFRVDHHGMKDFGCRMCGSKFGTRKALMRHELRVHKRSKMASGRKPLYLQPEYQSMQII